MAAYKDASNGTSAFLKLDICDCKGVYKLFEEEHPDIVVNFAAESHFDRSIENPAIFLQTNILGNTGALFRIKDQLTEDFLLLNADVMFDVDFKHFVAFHKSHGGLVTLFTHPNNHLYNSQDGSVEKWLAKEDDRPRYYRNRVSAGLHAINPKAGMLLQAAQDFNIDLTASYMVGDGDNDIQCGVNASCIPILATEEYSLLDFVNGVICKENSYD